MHFGRWWHARGSGRCRRKSCRAQQHAQAYCRTLYRASKHQVRRGRRAAGPSTGQGSAEPLCARIKGANREVSEGKAAFCTRSIFLLRVPTRSGERTRFLGRFSGMHRALDVCMLARAPASPAQGFHRHGTQVFQFHYFCTTCGLEKPGIVGQNQLERDLPLCC